MKGPFDDFLTLVVADCVNARYYEPTPVVPHPPVQRTECCGAMTGPRFRDGGAHETWCIKCNEQTCSACAAKVETDCDGYIEATCKECGA